MILDLWGISFHAVVLFGLGKNLLFKSILGRCDRSLGTRRELLCFVKTMSDHQVSTLLVHFLVISNQIGDFFFQIFVGLLKIYELELQDW